MTSVEFYGSYVLLEFDPNRALSLLDLARMQWLLTERIGVPIDLVEKRSIKPGLRDRILHVAIPL